MPASIRSTRYEFPAGPIIGPVLTDQSRDDLLVGNQILLESVFAATTYKWEFLYVPESPNRSTSSSAAFLAPNLDIQQTALFNVDYEGPYLVRLTVDQALPSEDITTVRLRQLTQFADLKIPGAGEKRDITGIIPVDIPTAGWTPDINETLYRINALARRQATSGRVLYVDSRRGRDSANTPSDTSYVIPGVDSTDSTTDLTYTTKHHGDFATVTDAIAYAQDAALRGEAALSSTDPYIIFVRPGLYEEDVTFEPWVYVIGENGTLSDTEQTTVIRSTTLHQFSPGLSSDVLLLSNLTLEHTGVSTDPVLQMTDGICYLNNVNVLQGGNSATQGQAIRITAGDLTCKGGRIYSAATTTATREALNFDSPGVLTLDGCTVEGEVGIAYNTSLSLTTTGEIRNCKVVGRQGYGIRGYGNLDLRHSTVTSVTSGQTVYWDGFGAAPAAYASTAALRLEWDSLSSDFYYDSTVANVFVLVANVVSNDVTRVYGENLFEQPVLSYQGTKQVVQYTNGTHTYSDGLPAVIGLDSSGGVITVTLGAAQDGVEIYLKDTVGSAFTNNITVNTNDASTIDGSASVMITTNYGALTLIRIGNNWVIV